MFWFKRKKVANNENTNVKKELNDFREKMVKYLPDISHEIRTPLNSILGLSKIGMASSNDKKMYDIFQNISEQANQLFTFWTEAFEFLRFDLKSIQITPNPFSIASFLNDLISYTKEQIIPKDIKFESQVDPIVEANLIGDTYFTRLVVLKFMEKAVEFTKSGGTISFNIHQFKIDDDTIGIQYCIKDTGDGMTDEQISLLFEPFPDKYDLEHKYHSSLAMCYLKMIVDKMNGSILVTSVISAGTTIKVLIPYKINKEEVIYMPSNPKNKFSGIRVLLAEERKTGSSSSKYVLENEGIIVDEFSSGKDALDAFLKSEKGYYDVILVDVMIKEMDGITMTKNIRSSNHPDAKKIPVLGMTPYVFDKEHKMSLDAGMNDYIVKPLDYFNVTSSLGKVLNSDLSKSLENFKVLVVDDNALDLEILSDLILDAKGEVLKARDGIEAARIFMESSLGEIDFILMNLNMPHLDGFKATKIIRGLNRQDAKSVKIFATSASIFPEKMEMVKQSGFDGAFIKPVDFEKILQTFSKNYN